MKQPKAVKKMDAHYPVPGWASYNGHAEVWADNVNSHLTTNRVEVVIVPKSHGVKLAQHAERYPQYAQGIYFALGFLELGNCLAHMVKMPKPARKPKCRTCKGEGTLSVGGADGIKCWTCGKRKAKKRSKR